MKRTRLPFDINKAWHHRLAEDVEFCFTDTMNGCTFAVDQNPTHPFISHYNYATAGTIDQAKTNRHITNRYNTPTRQVGAAPKRLQDRPGHGIQGDHDGYPRE